MASSALPLPKEARWRWPVSRQSLAVGLIILVALMQVELALTKSVNWDEFFHYAEINRALQGRAVSLLQTPYVKLFGWVPALPGSEIDHIRLIRLLLLPFEAVVAGSMFLIIRAEVDRQTAAVSVLAYLTGGYIFLHGIALRSDMIAAAFLMAALALASSRPPKPWVLGTVAILTALAMLSTVKSLFYFPAIAVALWLKLAPRSRGMAALAAGAVAIACTVFVLASPMLVERLLGPVAADTQATLRSAAFRMFPGTLLPQSRYFRWQIAFAPILAVITLCGFYLTARAPRQQMLINLARFVPLLGVAFYFNAFPYHYAFIMPPAVIASAPAVRMLIHRYGYVSLCVVLFGNAAILSVNEDRGVLQRQVDVIAGIHSIFPRPVTYIDDVGIVGGFPRAVNRFASGWGLADYRETGRTAYRASAEAEPVPLLIDDGGALDVLAGRKLSEQESLLPADRTFVRENYLPQWGKVFVAGKRIPAGRSTIGMTILVPGVYTLEMNPAEIDGVRYAAGDVISLARGNHTVRGPRSRESLLRWGNHLSRPNAPWPREPLFTDF